MKEVRSEVGALELIAIGEILVEMLATEVGQSFRSPGLFAGPYPSGAPAIFADQAARVGCSVALIGCVGADDFGRLNLDRLRASGVDLRAIRSIAERPTGSAFVAYGRDGARDFIFNIAESAAGMLEIAQLRPEIFRRCHIFHVMGSSLISAKVSDVIRHGIKLAKQAGAEISFDPNVRKELANNPAVHDAIQEIFSLTDIFLPSESDMEYFFPAQGEQTAVKSTLARGARIVLLKRGARGSTYFDAKQRIDTAAIPAREIDPTGAGDCFSGTFLSCLIQGLPLQRSLALANAAGALAVEARGPMEGNSNMAQLEQVLRERLK